MGEGEPVLYIWSMSDSLVATVCGGMQMEGKREEESRQEVMGK